MRLMISTCTAFALTTCFCCATAVADGPAEVPDTAKISESRKLVRDLFKQQYARSKDWPDLAKKLLKQADEAANDPPARYAMLDEARLLAAKAGDAETAVKATETLLASFKVSRAKIWAEISKQVLDATGRNPNAAHGVALLLITATDHAIDEDDWTSAQTLVRNAIAAARKARSASLLKGAQTRARRIVQLKTESDKVKKHLVTLKTKPDDPAANLAVGKYFCLYKLNWERGIPMLAKGSDAALKTAAGNDLLATAGVAEAKLTAADGWYALARKANKTESAGMKVRAHHWYQQALPKLTSLKKIKAQKRLAELAPVVASVGGSAANSSRWTAIRQQVAKKNYTKARIVGAAFHRKTYEEIPKLSAILIGFRYTTIKNEGRYPGFVQAIYKTAAGQVYGTVYGRPKRGENLYITKAKPGYAVGAIFTRGGGGFDALKPIYMRIKGNGLDTNDKYDGPHIGGMGGSSATLGGDGQFIIGIHGRLAREGHIQSVSPVSLGGSSSSKRPSIRRSRFGRSIRQRP